MNNNILGLLERNHDKTVFKTLGIETQKVDANQSVLRMVVDDRHKQHLGLVHGGIYVLLAESVMSIAAASSLSDPHDAVVAVDINASHLHKCLGGTLSAKSKCLHRGKKSLVYQAEIFNDQGQLLSTARSTLIIIRQPKTLKT